MLACGFKQSFKRQQAQGKACTGKLLQISALYKYNNNDNNRQNNKSVMTTSEVTSECDGEVTTQIVQISRVDNLLGMAAVKEMQTLANGKLKQ